MKDIDHTEFIEECKHNLYKSAYENNLELGVENCH